MQEFSELVGALYDAAIDPDLWTFVLQQMCAYLKIAQCTLVTEDALNPANSVFYQSFVDAEWTARYVQSYLLINPMRLALVANCLAGDAILTSDFMSLQEYHATPFYREWLSERGLVDIAVAILDKTATRITVLSAQRNAQQGPADEPLRQKLKLLTPHAQRAIAIGGLFEQKKVEAQGLAETLDALAAAVFILDKDDIVIHANERAQRVLLAGDAVRIADGRLTICDGQANRALREELSEAARAGNLRDMGYRTIAVPAATTPGFFAVVMPLAGKTRPLIAGPRGAVAAVCFKEVRFETPQTATAIGPLYKLTRREMAVMTASVEIGGVEEVARTLGMSANTVRSHLKIIYRKTGAAGRADLVKLVAATASPFQAKAAGTPAPRLR